MSSEAKHNNMPNQEGLYGWFPDVLADTKNPDPKNVYVYLGSRPPRERSFHGKKIVFFLYITQSSKEC
jgi:hypothetical protein